MSEQKKYKYVTGFFKKTIERREIVGETEQYVTYETKSSFNNHVSVRKVKKHSRHEKWFDTFDEARDSRIKAMTRGVEGATQNLANAKKSLEMYKAMTEKDTHKNDES